MLWALLVALFFSAPAYAEDKQEAAKKSADVYSIEILGGGLTYHVVSLNAQRYTDKISDDGRLIANLIYGLGFNYLNTERDLYVSAHLFKGNNSVHQPINGGNVSLGAAYTYIDVGFVAGCYVQNDYDFIGTGLTPFSITRGSNAIVPIVGLEVNPKIHISEKIYLKQNNLFTPVITNHTLSIGYDL